MDKYISAAAQEVQPILKEIRRIVKGAVPDAEETMSYRMPAFKRKRTFFYFAAFKNHIGIYPPVTDDTELISEVAPYANKRGNLRFLLSEPIPYDLISRVAVALSAQHS